MTDGGRLTLPDLPGRLNTLLAGRYTIQRELGSGGMASVFLAEDLKHRRSVAIKVLRPDLATAIGPQRFLREIEVAASLQHPHILPLLDSGNAGELLYYVMPYVAGESLRARLEHERQLPVRDALRLAEQVASALDYAHRQGVVHRDIKPENILLADGQAVVADFGIARAIAAVGAAKLTETGITLGTPMYMSPEQAMAVGALDGRSDVYSLGCVLYEMLSGQPPFTGATAENLVHQHLSVAPRPVTALRTTVPKGVEQALVTALAKAPADRFGTAAEFAAAVAASHTPPEGIEAVVPLAGPHAGSPAGATAATLPMAAGRGRRRRPGLVAAAAIVAALALVAWLVGPWRDHARPAAPAKRAWMMVAEFEGPDSSTATTLRDLVVAALEQSEIVSVVPNDQIRLALQRAGKPPTTRVDTDLARELAYRSAVRTVLEGKIGRLGNGYSIVLRVEDIDSARVVVSLSDAAGDEAALIPTVSRITRRLRGELGERRTAIQATHDLGSGITPSLEAFKLLMTARQRLFSLDQRAAITVARSALAIDPEFASAWGVMGFAFSNLGETDSAIHAFRQSLARPDRLSEYSQLLGRAAVADLSGDIEGALALYEQSVQLNPDRWASHNNRGACLFRVGRLNEALASYRNAENASPFGPNQQVLSNQFQVLLTLGRVDEARQVAPRLTGSLGLFAPVSISMAAGRWSEAESLASAVSGDPGLFADQRFEADWIRATAQASSGQVIRADQAFRRMQSQAESAKSTSTANLVRWGRLSLALYFRGFEAAPEAPGRWDSTSLGLATHGAWAATAGDTTLARRLLETMRTRSAPEIKRLGFAPAIAEGWIAARAGRWEEVLRRLGPSALQGEPRGIIEFRSAPLVRWLVAEAYERVGPPDSAAAYFERAIAPPPDGGWSFAEIRLAYPFGHRRLALLYTRLGRLEEARRHWQVFQETVRTPGIEMAPMVEEARVALANPRVGAPAAR